jgi:hypothetical protein
LKEKESIMKLENYLILENTFKEESMPKCFDVSRLKK